MPKSTSPTDAPDAKQLPDDSDSESQSAVEPTNEFMRDRTTSQSVDFGEISKSLSTRFTSFFKKNDQVKKE